MYDLPLHKEHDQKNIEAFMLQYPFAFLAGRDTKGNPIATQVPLLLDVRGGKEYLIGHLMKGMDHHKAFVAHRNVLAVFTGKNAYVSGTWYSNPNTASTWNYMSVHVKGRMDFLEGARLEQILKKTTLHFEDHDVQSPTVFDNLPMAFKQKVMHAIVGFEIEILELDTVFKLSQDRDATSYLSIIERLKESDHDGRVIASEMEERFPQVYPNFKSLA